MSEPAFKIGDWVEARGMTGLGPGRITSMEGCAKTPYLVRWEQSGASLTLSFAACDLRRIHSPRRAP